MNTHKHKNIHIRTHPSKGASSRRCAVRAVLLNIHRAITPILLHTHTHRQRHSHAHTHMHEHTGARGAARARTHSCMHAHTEGERQTHARTTHAPTHK